MFVIAPSPLHERKSPILTPGFYLDLIRCYIEIGDDLRFQADFGGLLTGDRSVNLF